ncbi:TRAP transporter small permease [Neolewinella lacunae]|uniref:TRAP transporter small permease n=1 Tax=Neolewinella lacunae TaxID=1517758 RepID=A0A923PFE5_9BACT|nr:TRAP transporter small permease [Neolewinella lacunae]MBC6993128.1 TRAP transporter small permease [Neolewinella lacunae]MDN3633138.1 TRAP transporter small permease [Neolewinella lacunae]
MKPLKFLGYLCALLLAVQVVVVLWGVITRYALGNQAGWTEELAGYLLIWISLMGAAYAVGTRSHIAISLFPDGLPPARRRRVNRIIDGLILCFAVAVMMVGGSYYVWLTLSLGQRAPSLQLPVGLVYLAVPVAGLFVSFFQLKDLIYGRD